MRQEKLKKKTRIIDKILKQLTPERIKKELAEIQAVELPEELQKWVKEYEKVGDRDQSFWKLIYLFNKKITSIPFNENQKKSVLKTKFLLSLFIILLDDVADESKNASLLGYLLEIPSKKTSFAPHSLNKKESIYFNLANRAWIEITKAIKGYPLYKELKEIFFFDIKQIMNAMDYSFLINKFPFIANATESWAYPAHSSQGIINCTIELMCFPKVEWSELGKIREAFWYAQQIARLANCINTWEKELVKKDFSGSVIQYAIATKTITPKQLTQEKTLSIKVKSKLFLSESKILEKMDHCFEELNKICGQIQSINLKPLLEQLEFLFIQYTVAKNYNMKN